jgi:hypothetical protein
LLAHSCDRGCDRSLAISGLAQDAQLILTLMLRKTSGFDGKTGQNPDGFSLASQQIQ